ncbi:4Fe-4S dicluster domain-containing protein [uncultured Succiniclasticum sp.]|uniref:4Fe-4S dicluster domain-containing protein n=1 Tax=uncultured Succiniclasticum sp. TaxID=1500547 RepID=UPI0025D29357|nr:4Fe-4S dicluster domain-containing protein [uncultured Succiniclasticum sp.]
MKQMKRAVVNRELCVACGSCQKVCPMGAIRVYKGLYAQTDEARCIGCGRCAKECPASVITVEARHEN